MKKAILVSLVIGFPVYILSQEVPDTIDITNVSLDLLKSPTNATFVVMNTTPTEIVEPGSAPEFFVSAQNASNNFSSFPNNYGFTITPFWWGKGARELTFDKDFATENSLKFYRTLQLSGAIVKGIGNEENLWRYALGGQVTLLRGKIESDKRAAYIKHLTAYHDEYKTKISSLYHQDEFYTLLLDRRDSIHTQLRLISELLRTNSIDGAQARLQTEALSIVLKETLNTIDARKVELDSLHSESLGTIESSNPLNNGLNEISQRYGFKWDIGGGSAFNSNYNKVDSLGIYRIGIWSNIGYSPKSTSKLASFTGIFMVRYFHFNEVNYIKDQSVELIEGLNTIDFGGKIQFNPGQKFILGIEYIHRMALSHALYESNYKLNGIVQYQFGSNKLVYASFGNQFNDNSAKGPTDLVVSFGLNIGIGDPIILKEFKLN